MHFCQSGKSRILLIIETVGLKVVDKTKMEPKMTKMLLREIQVMDLCQHPHLVRLYEVLETRTKLYLVMQYGPGGDLFMKVSQSGETQTF